MQNRATTPSIRLATRADAPRLSAFAAETFRDTFAPDNDPTNLAIYLSETFSIERQAAEIEDPNSIILVAEVVDESGSPQFAGYAHLLAGDAPAMVTHAAPIELARFYVSRTWHGRGLAQALMNEVLKAARKRGADTIWLGVWERNPRAVAFYRKYGFQQVGAKTFMLGNDVQNDFVLARSLH